MATLRVPKDDPIIREIKKLAQQACIRLRMEEKRFTDGETTWTSVCISFEKIPDHGIEVFICPVPPNGLKAVKVGEDGTVEKEAPIDVGVDPNPIVPFTGGQRLAGPNTF